jgi:hypothetical protein
MLRIRGHDNVDPYISVYSSPDPKEICEITSIQLKGMISPSVINQLLQILSYVLAYIRVTMNLANQALSIEALSTPT